MQTEFSPVAVERYPMRFEPVFRAASAAVGSDLESHQVTIKASVSDYLQLVLAAPKPLEDLLCAILLTLVQDAREESRLTVEAVQEQGGLVVTLANQGFGMPQEKFDRFLKEGAGAHETLDAIGSGINTAKAWGGSLKVRSEVGSGIVFTMKLRSVI